MSCEKAMVQTRWIISTKRDWRRRYDEKLSRYSAERVMSNRFEMQRLTPSHARLTFMIQECSARLEEMWRS